MKIAKFSGDVKIDVQLTPGTCCEEYHWVILAWFEGKNGDAWVNVGSGISRSPSFAFAEGLTNWEENKERVLSYTWPNTDGRVSA